MKNFKEPAKHILPRLAILPGAAAIVYLIISNIEFGDTELGWSDAFFGASCILAMVFISEIILFFTKYKKRKIMYNVVLIITVFILVFIIKIGL